jgi:biotin transport system substrate-specific component
MSARIKNLTLAALFAALITVGAWIKIPFLPVPLTLQFFFLNTAILVCKPGYSALSVLAYIFMGLAGLPVFSGGGGPAYILSPTFGYIIGFLTAAALSVLIKPGTNRILHSLMNISVIYLLGLTYLYLISNLYLETGITLSKTLIYGCLIFLPGDFLSIILSCIIVKKLEKFSGHKKT